jgi:hypothetical protein
MEHPAVLRQLTEGLQDSGHLPSETGACGGNAGCRPGASTETVARGGNGETVEAM